MKKITLFIFLLAASATSFAQSAWKVDKAHAQLKFDVQHMGLSTVSGSFTDFDATITSDKPDFSDAKFELTAQATSINTGVGQRDDHLRSPDFFDVATNPTVSFKSTSLQKVSEGKYKVTGDLTLHGVTKPVTLDLWYRGTANSPMTKKPVAGFRVTGSIKRSDFNFGSKFPAAALSEEVTITADGEFNKQ
ncbi:YceI family protein [Chitinophaga niabensis]|jgi:polyisoprenoid-binding protein YceI|uniref:Polyisoprenoid-binding protein YceI n=1 Tax=Chitinophaga niabensis TaxID=536979 RepID=A0A1N6K9P6_9BACT|nr:YceI family protein [Chitinophaga niabensis]SIO53309.1 Polyisoprenoid-binding protein YceI [Chitinophaga niabensis]